MVGEQPYKSRDMVGSDSGLGGLLVNVKAHNIEMRRKRVRRGIKPENFKSLCSAVHQAKGLKVESIPNENFLQFSSVQKCT